MNKILRRLAGVFGASPIPQAGLNAQLMMDKYLLGAHIRDQHGKMVRHFYYQDGLKPIGLGFRKKRDAEPTMLRSTPFCHVVKAGFKKSVIRIHGLELLVENKYIKQPKSITKSV
ncbi:hypothetical protein [Aeromonas phage PVN02]|nr:hypothetical protein [Aeromonas phage PVN02]QTQ06878.1 hypothetical protein [Aeromonas phage PVN04]CAC9972300.1 hypothetical protein PVN02_00033 [Aeromonas phage PVN02]